MFSDAHLKESDSSGSFFIIYLVIKRLNKVYHSQILHSFANDIDMIIALSLLLVRGLFLYLKRIKNRLIDTFYKH